MTSYDSESIRQTDIETEVELDSHTDNEYGQSFAATGTLMLDGSRGELTFTFSCEATTEDTDQYADPYLTTDAIHYHVQANSGEEHDSWSGQKDLHRSEYDTPEKLLTAIEDLMAELAADGSLYTEQMEREAQSNRTDR